MSEPPGQSSLQRRNGLMCGGVDYPVQILVGALDRGILSTSNTVVLLVVFQRFGTNDTPSARFFLLTRAICTYDWAPRSTLVPYMIYYWCFSATVVNGHLVKARRKARLPLSADSTRMAQKTKVLVCGAGGFIGVSSHSPRIPACCLHCGMPDFGGVDVKPFWSCVRRGRIPARDHFALLLAT